MLITSLLSNAFIYYVTYCNTVLKKMQEFFKICNMSVTIFVTKLQLNLLINGIIKNILLCPRELYIKVLKGVTKAIKKQMEK